MATTLALSGAARAAADGTRDDSGQLMFPGGFAAIAGLQQVTVPNLASPLAYDRERVYLIVNGQLSSVEVSTDFRFAYDATTFRVKARVACAVPDPAKSIRKLTITGSGSGDGGTEPLSATVRAQAAPAAKTPPKRI